MTTAEQNYLLLQEIEANRKFLLMAYQQNPKLLESAEARIRQLFEAEPSHGLEAFGGKLKQRGISLIELIMFIVIVSVSLAGILTVMNAVMTHSADPLVHKQALAAAESLLEEIELQDFTSANTGSSLCPHNQVTPATRANGYHIVCDYNGFTTPGVFSITNTAIPGLANYNVNVIVLGSPLGAITPASSVLITVQVTGPLDTIQVSGYRTAY
jgi:MSHA pilin protein MshD